MLANGRAALSARAPYLHARAWSILTLTALLFAAALVVAPSSVRAVGTVIIQTNIVGVTPSVLAYNAGHFCPGSNTRDWWRYSGTTGARVFLTAGIIEPGDDIPGWGDGVSDQTGFINRKAALRADPLNTNYINWPYLIPNFNRTAQHGSNIINPADTCAELRQIGVRILVCEGASESTFPLTNTTDWAGIWELWQHYYAQAFYLAQNYDVERYQVFNEPNLVNNLTLADFYQRVQIVSDAVQSAIEDVNRLYAKALTPMIFSPVTAGTASGEYSSWGRILVTNRHTDMFGNVDANHFLIRKYDYHQYNSAPAKFGADLAALNTLLDGDMAPEPRFPTSISEFNVHTAGTFDNLSDTLDTPADYTALGSILVNLANNGCDELYLFKFSQTLNSTTVKKNGTHFVDNTNAPYNIGGVTRAGEVYRLFNLAAAPGRTRLGVALSANASGLQTLAAYDPVSKFYTLLSANPSADAPVTLDLRQLNVPEGEPVILSEVSESCWGAVKSLLSVSGGQVVAGLQPSNTVWLFTIPTKAQEALQTVPCTDDATVRDGFNEALNFGAESVCEVRNNSTNASLRSAALLKFHLPLFYHPDTQIALLALHASSINGATNAQAHVYGLTDTNWSDGAVTWDTAPNLERDIPAGSDYINNFITGAGDSAFLVGQMVASATAADRFIDVTKYLRDSQGQDLSFLLAREVRFFGDAQDDDGLQFSSREGGTNGPRLLIVRLKDTDGDGLSDEAETTVFNTNPDDPDTDHDSFSDGEEVLLYGTNPGTNTITAPSFNSEPSDQIANRGDTVAFNASASGTPPLAYQWFFNGTNALLGATAPTLTLPNVQLSQAGTYSISVSNQAGVIASSNALLSVVVPPPPPLPQYEPFDYAAGSAVAGQGGWVVNSGTSATVENGNLSLDGLSPALGNRITWGNPSMSLRLPLNTNMTSGLIYFSFILRVDSLGSMTSYGTLAGFATGTTTSFGTKVNLLPVGGGFYLGTSKASGTNYGGWSSRIFSQGESIFVVGRYTFNGGSKDDTCDLWLDPASSTFGAASPPLPSVSAVGAGGTDLSPIDRFFFRSGGGSGSNPAKTTTDELRLGLTWADVTTPAIPPLAIKDSGVNVLLSWPTNAAGFQLQASPAVLPASWSVIPNSAVVNGTNFNLTLPATNQTRFFRLAR